MGLRRCGMRRCWRGCGNGIFRWGISFSGMCVWGLWGWWGSYLLGGFFFVGGRMFLIERTHWADGRRQKSIVCPSFAIPDTATQSGTALGPLWLQDPRVANVVVGAIQYGESIRQFYHLHAWVVMSNHVHLIFQPVI